MNSSNSGWEPIISKSEEERLEKEWSKNVDIFIGMILCAVIPVIILAFIAIIKHFR